MDCVRAQELISAAIDEPETASSPAFVAARTHCATCPSCRAFATAATTLWRSPAAKAPEGLVERILDAVNVEAEAKAARETAKAERDKARQDTQAAEAPNDDQQAETPPQLPTVLPFPVVPMVSRRRLSPNQLVWIGSVAAVLLVMFGVARLGLSLMQPPRQSTTQLAQAPSEGAAPTVADPDVATTPEADADTGRRAEKEVTADGTFGAALAVAPTPPYVTLGTHVYEEQAELAAMPRDTVSAGWVFTSRASDTPSNVAARVSKDASSLYLEATSTVVQYRAVTRLFAGKRFVLTSQAPLDRYGKWPALPARFSQPTSSDGAPTFQPSVMDDSGRQTYVPQGEQPADGFALAPDPSTNGNPNWTWWEPMP